MKARADCCSKSSSLKASISEEQASIPSTKEGLCTRRKCYGLVSLPVNLTCQVVSKRSLSHL